MGTDMYQDIRLESITAIKIYVSDEEFGETLCTDDEKLVYVVDDLPQTSDSYQDFLIDLGEEYSGYVQIVIETAATSEASTNGFVRIMSVNLM